MDDDDDTKLYEVLFVKAIVSFLKEDEGVIIHHEGSGYAIYLDSSDEALKIVHDDDFLAYGHGQLLWMQYDGTKAPKPEFDEPVLGEEPTLN
jgi:hypothetical protein